MGLVLFVSNGGSATFIDRGGAVGVSGVPLRRCDRAARTVASLQVSDCDLLSPNVGVSLASSSSHNCLILALVAISSAWGFETMTVLLFKVLEGPAANLLATVFYGMVMK